MDALRPILQQYRELFRSMSPGQRATLLAVALAVAGVFGVLLTRAGGESHVPLTWGKAFTAEELAVAEQTLLDAGLTEYRRDGRRLLVPASDVERYNAALLQGESLPSNYAEELERQLDKQSIFTSERQSRAYRDLALKKELRRIIRAIPDVEDADVVWARGEPGRWPNRGGRVTATVSVRLRANQELSPQMVQSLRTAVASMVPDLKTADVVVFDLKTGTSHVPGSEGDQSHASFARARELTQSCQRKISEALSYIPGVLVTVNVDAASLAAGAPDGTRPDPRQSVDRGQPPWPSSATHHHAHAEWETDSSRPRTLSDPSSPVSTWPTAHRALKLASFETSEAEASPAAMARHSVQVSVQIPEDYYLAVALKRGLREGTSAAERAEFRRAVDAIRVQEEKKAQATAALLIPAGSPATAVAVSSFVPVGDVEPADDTAPVPQAISFSQFGAAIGLGTLALWTVWSRRRKAARRSLISASAPALEAPLEPDSPAVAALEWKEPEPAAVACAPPMIFDDLVQLDDRTVKMLLENVETTCWAVALKGASQEFRRKVFRAISPRIAELIEEEMDALGPVRLSDIDAAQERIIEALR